MTTDKQIEANRANAEHSTGPTSQQGKDNARHNAVKHGMTSQSAVIPRLGESHEDFERLHQALREDLQPAGELQEHIVTNITRKLWGQERGARAQVGATIRGVLSVRTEAKAQAHQALTAAMEAINVPPPPLTAAETVNVIAGEIALAAYDRSLLPRIQAASTLLSYADGVEWIVHFLDHVRIQLAKDGRVAVVDWQILLAVGLRSKRPLLRWALAQRSQTRSSLRNSSSDNGTTREITVSTAEREELIALLEKECTALIERVAVLRQEEEALLKQEVEARAIPRGPELDQLLRYETAASNAIHKDLRMLMELKRSEGAGTQRHARDERA